MAVYELDVPSESVLKLKPAEALELAKNFDKERFPDQSRRGIIISGPRWIGKSDILRKAAEDSGGIYCRGFEDLRNEDLGKKKRIYIDDLYNFIWEALADPGKADLLLNALRKEHVVSMSIYELEWTLKNLSNIGTGKDERWGKKIVDELKKDLILLPEYKEEDVKEMHSLIGFAPNGIQVRRDIKIEVDGRHSVNFKLKTRDKEIKYSGFVPKSVIAEEIGIFNLEPRGYINKLIDIAGSFQRIFDVEMLSSIAGSLGQLIPQLALFNPATALFSAFVLRDARNWGHMTLSDLALLAPHKKEEKEKEKGVPPGTLLLSEGSHSPKRF